MDSIEWSSEGIALIVTAIGGVIIGIIQALKIARRVQQIDTAVNGKPEGGATMVSQVQDLHDAAVLSPTPPAILPLVQQIHAAIVKEESG